MRHPVHAITSARREWKPEHVAGIGFVAALHVAAIGAIVSGLVPKIVQLVPHDIVLTVPRDETPPVLRQKPPEPEHVKLPQYRELTAVKPVIDIAPADAGPQAPDKPETPQPPSRERTASLAPDTAAVAIAGTHTAPPYPLLERRLASQGTVTLRLTISAGGTVVAADVVQSSGFSALDQAAVSWVMQHWRYKPAVRGGAPAASTTVAAVVFNIRNGG